ncbi:Hsp20/alpha crystallin family protein [Patulibacter sp.]|uniref:Hsp20/alpha crystallin family protein n=1 Tax=Patulibacter sp. TaxID=1912859 RepID=UPI0027194011|nr:Hsp20/alpha crystallin family protein [Patulibacter sp.]MDO9409214.1 Hsp20/alpha crystallin family protein [Patulibacter sp.]
MRSREGDLFANFERVRREMDELFGGVLDRGLHGRTHRAGFEPAVDVFCETPEGGEPRVVVHAELAGIDPERVALEIRGKELVLAGSRAAGEAEGRAYQQVEIGTGAFRRSVPLGVEVHTDRARATYRDGILRVELPIRTDAETTDAASAGSDS